MAAVPPQASFRKLTDTLCVPVAKLPATLTACDWPAAWDTVAVWTPPTWLPSTVTVNCASPCHASSDTQRVSAPGAAGAELATVVGVIAVGVGGGVGVTVV